MKGATGLAGALAGSDGTVKGRDRAGNTWGPRVSAPKLSKNGWNGGASLMSGSSEEDTCGELGNAGTGQSLCIMTL